MERSFAEDVKQLGYGAGQVLRGEGILAITKALLESGVSYVGGYPGAPVSHLIDVLADANEPLLKPMGGFSELTKPATSASAPPTRARLTLAASLPRVRGGFRGRSRSRSASWLAGPGHRRTEREPRSGGGRGR